MTAWTFRIGVLAIVFTLLIFTTLSSQTRTAEVTAGQPLPVWERGILDIHYINTGTGDAVFLILPDGTTLLVDAAAGYRDSQVKSHYDAPQRPNASLRPGEWVARYIQRMHPEGLRGALDYVVLTHFHGDHIGNVVPASPISANGAYRLTGITDVGDQVQIRRILDHQSPNYTFPPTTGPDAPLAETMRNYRGFLKWQSDNRGLVVERFEAGRNDQIVLRYSPQDFPTFEVRNLAANGAVWTGSGASIRNRFPSGIGPNENNSSIVFRMNYGSFTYFHGGDIAGVPDAPIAGVPNPGAPAWNDMESAVAWVTGPVDVAAVNHHGTPDAANEVFLSILQPRVHILSTWAASQPGPDVLRRLLSERIYPGPRDVFMTNWLWPDRLEHMVKLYGEADAKWLVEQLNQIASNQGHVLVRVDAGGASYRVIVIDDSKEEGEVLSVHGPYKS